MYRGEEVFGCKKLKVLIAQIKLIEKDFVSHNYGWK